MLVVMVPARSTFAETSGTLIAAILKIPRTKGGRFSARSLAGQTAPTVRRSISHLVNLTMNYYNLVGSVLAYVFYWITTILLLVFLKWKEVSGCCDVPHVGKTFF